MNMVRYFLKKVVEYPEKEFCFLMDYLGLCKADDELTIEILNVLDSYLDEKRGNIVLSVAKLLAKLVQENKPLKISLVKRIVPVFNGFFKGSYRDFQIQLIDFISSLDSDYVSAFGSSYKQFFIKGKDPELLKVKKINMLSLVTSGDNCMEVANYLLNLLPQNKEINKEIIAALGNIANKEPACSDHCVKNFNILVKTDSDTFLLDILSLVKHLKLKTNPALDKVAVKHFVQTVASHIVVEDDLIAADISSLLYLIGEFCEHIEQSPYIIEDLVARDKSDWPVELFSQLLETSYTTFLTYPPAMQTLLGKVMKILLQQNSHELHEKVLVYYSLLSAIGEKG